MRAHVSSVSGHSVIALRRQSDSAFIERIPVRLDARLSCQASVRSLYEKSVDRGEFTLVSLAA